MDIALHSDKQETAVFGYHDHGFLVTACTTGIQWGKTTAGALWLKWLMHTFTSPDDNFIITSPSYPILAQSTLPPFLRLMDGLGHYNKKDNCFHMYKGGTCWFRTGTNPDSIVGITNVRGILCDEAGLYSLYFWENIQARASFKQAPIMIVTSPYSLNWLFKEIIRPKLRDADARPDVLWIHATSKENPFFPQGEYERKRETMDPRRFNMVYGGNFERMEGLVYKMFTEANNTCEPLELPASTKYFCGVDWGSTHPFVLTPRGITPSGHHFQVGEFYKTGLAIRDMVLAAKQMKATWGVEMFYADPARPDLIKEFNIAGLTCVAAENDILTGIEHHRDLVDNGMYKVFKRSSPHTMDEYEVYHYPDPKDLKPDQDDKDPLPVDKDNHCMDANRYVSIHKHKITRRLRVSLPTDPAQMAHDQRIEWLKRKNRRGRQTEDWS